MKFYEQRIGMHRGGRRITEEEMRGAYASQIGAYRELEKKVGEEFEHKDQHAEEDLTTEEKSIWQRRFGAETAFGNERCHSLWRNGSPSRSAGSSI